MSKVRITVDIDLFKSKVERLMYEHRRFFCSEKFVRSFNAFTEDEIDDIFCNQEFYFICDSQDLSGARCFCMEEDNPDGYEIFEWSDYVTRPMVWCQECGAIECVPEFEEKDGKATFIYPLVTIDKVLNTQLYSWKWTPELFKDHINDFLAIRQRVDLYHSDKIREEEKFAEKIGLEPEEDYTIYNKDKLWDIASVINAVDGQSHPSLPLDMSHDGIAIFHTCHHDECGDQFHCSYWGD